MIKSIVKNYVIVNSIWFRIIATPLYGSGLLHTVQTSNIFKVQVLSQSSIFFSAITIEVVGIEGKCTQNTVVDWKSPFFIFVQRDPKI